MKRFLVFTLVLSIIFPAYCFSAPSGIPVREKSSKSIEEITGAIELIMEDGKVEEEEIISLLEDIEPNQSMCDLILLMTTSSLI